MPLAVILHGHDAEGKLCIRFCGSLCVRFVALVFAAFAGEEETGKADEACQQADGKEQNAELLHLLATEQQEQSSRSQADEGEDKRGFLFVLCHW